MDDLHCVWRGVFGLPGWLRAYLSAVDARQMLSYSKSHRRDGTFAAIQPTRGGLHFTMLLLYICPAELSELSKLHICSINTSLTPEPLIACG
jgi:hypothetical protein